MVEEIHIHPSPWGEIIKGFLVDITGVLYNSGGPAIEGSIEAVRRLYAESQVRFVSNESTGTREAICEKLRRIGFDMLKPEHIFTPAPVVAKYIQKHGLRPHLLVHRDVLPEFEECLNSADPNGRPCLVLADAEHDLSFENMNRAFRMLLNSEKPLLLSLGNGKFYQRADEGPCLDTGSYAAAFKFALENGDRSCEHVVMGKPERDYFLTAVEDLGLGADQIMMIGDDILGDVGGAQAAGIWGCLVRTGKWRPDWESHPTVKPDFIADTLLNAVTIILGNPLVN